MGPQVRVCVLLAALVGGCQNPKTGAPLTLADVFEPLRPSTPAATAPADGGESFSVAGDAQTPRTILQLHFDVLRTQAPVGTFSQSDKIWNHLDEKVVPAELAAVLQKNGLRIGRGKMSAWHPIKAILDLEKAVQAFQNGITLHNGLPLTIELDQRPQDQSPFVYRPDGTLRGLRLTAGMNLLRIEYAIPVTHPDSVLIEMMPETRLEAPEPRLTVNGWTQRPPVRPSEIFRELSVRMLVGPDEFVAVGPSSAVTMPHTLGALMLIDQVENQPRESVLFITPRVIRKQIKPALVSGGG
ncbi:MAG: hypothetical protein HRF43_10230 [Phycisphaerae bacterium]|jgi:hypothetical protein